MAAGSPSCSSSTSPTASIATNATDLQETDASFFSDDSGVDVKPQGCGGDGGRYHHPPKHQHHDPRDVANGNRRNKRKSSEPKRRGDVLLMKRFRWDSEEEEEDIRDDEDNDDVFDREELDGERPGSGDSGCQLHRSPAEAPHARCTVKKKRPRQWRKPKVEAIKEEEEEDTLPAFRQSVICKNETTPSCTGTGSHLHHDPRSVVSSSSPPVSTVQARVLVAEGDCTEDHDPIASGTAPPRSGNNGRPRNYKSMSRQRRIEANARERTRVHTISAAFDSLRRAVPAYAHNQKLSKLAILRIASAYIVALACLSGGGGSESPSSMAECVERCTRTIQAEGRSRRRTSKE